MVKRANIFIERRQQLRQQAGGSEYHHHVYVVLLMPGVAVLEKCDRKIQSAVWTSRAFTWA